MQTLTILAFSPSIVTDASSVACEIFAMVTLMAHPTRPKGFQIYDRKGDKRWSWSRVTYRLAHEPVTDARHRIC
jgi:membrane associated rhomboid family serine protease